MQLHDSRHDRPTFAQLVAVLDRYAAHPECVFAGEGGATEERMMGGGGGVGQGRGRSMAK